MAAHRRGLKMARGRPGLTGGASTGSERRVTGSRPRVRTATVVEKQVTTSRMRRTRPRPRPVLTRGDRRIAHAHVTRVPGWATVPPAWPRRRAGLVAVQRSRENVTRSPASGRVPRPRTSDRAIDDRQPKRQAGHSRKRSMRPGPAHHLGTGRAPQSPQSGDGRQGRRRGVAGSTGGDHVVRQPAVVPSTARDSRDASRGCPPALAARGAGDPRVGIGINGARRNPIRSYRAGNPGRRGTCTPRHFAEALGGVGLARHPGGALRDARSLPHLLGQRPAAAEPQVVVACGRTARPGRVPGPG